MIRLRLVGCLAAALLLLGCPVRRTSVDDDDDDDATDAPDDDDASTDDDDDGASAPSSPTVAIEPAEPVQGDALHCSVTADSVDPEGGTVVYSFAWLRDGTEAGVEVDDVGVSTTLAGELWSCLVTPHAGDRSGDPGQADVTVGQANRAPEAPAVTIDPPGPRANQGFTCVLSSEPVDPDGDEVSLTFDWLMDGSPQGISDPAIAAELTLEGQEWTCVVTASDGELASEPGEASAIIRAAAWTADVTSEGIDYTASSCFACPDETWYIPDKAFDDTLCTSACSWHTTWTGGPEWVGIDFGKANPKTITRYGLMGSAFHEGYRAVDWELQGSNDAAVWTVLHQVVGANLVYVMWGGEPFTYYEFDNSSPFQHYRVHVTENAGGQPFADEVGIVEIAMFENAP